MKEIVISGLGVMTSIGSHIEECWDGLLEGRHGVKKIQAFDVTGQISQLGCEIENVFNYFPPTGYSFGRATSMIMPAIEDALYEAGLDLTQFDSARVGVCIGTTMGEIEGYEAALMHGATLGTYEGGPQMIGKNIVQYLGINGPSWTITNACAAGNFALARAVEDLRLDRADVMIVGGVDALSWAAFTGFNSLRAMTPDFCRPFDQERKGLLLGEGAGVIILETMAHVLKRGGEPRARVLGYGMNGDAHHITQPDPQAKGAIRAMRQALEMGGILAAEIGYISAHGTGTPANDRMEAVAISSMFGVNMPTSSIKGNIGHTLGAASAIEAAIAVKVLETGLLPFTQHLRKKDPLCQVDVIAHEPRKKKIDYLLSNAFAFGGINSSILLGRVS